MKKNRVQRPDNLSKALYTPCTVKECVDIAKAVSADAIEEFSKVSTPHEVQQTLYIETILEILEDSGLIDPEKFEKHLSEKVKDYNIKRAEYLKSLSKGKEGINELPSDKSE